MSKTSFLLISVSSWKPDNYGLFDYSSANYHKSQITVSKQSTLYSSGNIIYLPSPHIYNGSSPILSINKLQNNYQISLNSEDPNLSIWKVVKKHRFCFSSHKLTEDDWIKLGKSFFYVKKINSSRIESVDFSQIFSNQNLLMNITQISETCRICLNDSNSNEDPLICPCNCSGTMSSVHVKCLKEWIKCRMHLRTSAKTFSFYAKDMTCELCKIEFPLRVSNKNQLFNLIDFSWNSHSAYVLLEEYNFERNSKIAVHGICLRKEESAKIGRGSQADLKLTDMSISRSHCKIELIGQSFYIKDEESKFGTLVKLPNDVLIEDKLCIQVGRFSIKITEKSKFRCCFKKSLKVEDEEKARKNDNLEVIDVQEEVTVLLNQKSVSK